ncbi:MAG: phosphomannomutase/phosphoglucomutase [Pseudomonadota bacterium]
MSSHYFHKSLIRAYDLRGVIGKTLFAADALALGCALGTMLNVNQRNLAIVGYDARNSSTMLENELTRGLASTGFHVQKIGLCATPELYFVTHQLKAKLGIMITGSHNAKEYNGFKIIVNGNIPLYGEKLQYLSEIASKGRWKFNYASIVKMESRNAYIKYLIESLDVKKPLKIAWDPANAAFCPALQDFCNKTKNLEHIIINSKVDGNFPNHHPDPTKKENLTQLAHTIQKYHCDIGIAFDGDGDRIAVLDHKGNIISIDHLICLFIEDVLSKKPKSTIIGDIKLSNIVFNHAQKLGGKTVLSKTGHSFIRSKILETGALFAGEASGHLFFSDLYLGYDDALYAAIRLINIVSHSPVSLNQLVARLPKVFSIPETRVHVEEQTKALMIKKISEQLRQQNIKYNDLDIMHELVRYSSMVLLLN